MELFPKPEQVFELNRFFVIVSLIIFFTALFLWPLGWLFRQPRLNKDGKESPKYRPMFTIGRYLAMLLVIFSLASYFFLRKHVDIIDNLTFQGIVSEGSFLTNLMYSLPSILSVLVPVQLLLLVFIWLGKHGTKIFRIQYSFVSLALLIFLMFLISWNQVDPGYYFIELF